MIALELAANKTVILLNVSESKAAEKQDVRQPEYKEKSCSVLFSRVPASAAASNSPQV